LMAADLGTSVETVYDLVQAKDGRIFSASG
jgi:hypothetical protein